MSEMKREPLTIAIVVGDPFGDTIENVLAIIASDDGAGLCRPVIVGDYVLIEKTATARSCAVALKRVELNIENESDREVLVVDKLAHPYAPRVENELKKAGQRIVADLESAMQLSAMGKVHAIAVAPVNMRALHEAGFHYDDLTELFEEWFRVEGNEVQRRQLASYVYVVEGIPIVAVIAEDVGGDAGTTKRGEVMKEAIEHAVKLARARS